MTEPTDDKITAIDLTGPGEGVHVETFDSLDDLFAKQAERHEQAMAGLLPMQRELLEQRKFWWVRPYEEFGILIFGEFDLDSSIAKEKSLTPSDEQDHFPGWLIEFEHRNQVRGFKFGMCYSTYEPQGELGNTHVATMLPISQEAFEEARLLGWDHTKAHPDSLLLRELEEGFSKAAREQAAL